MALPMDAMTTTPVYRPFDGSHDKTARLNSAPLPPAPPRCTRTRIVLSAGREAKCMNMSFSSLRMGKAVKHPTLELAVQQRRHSSPAILAFQTAFLRMKEKGAALGDHSEAAHSTSQRRGRSSNTKDNHINIGGGMNRLSLNSSNIAAKATMSNTGNSNNKSKSKNTTAALDKLNAMFPTSPASIKRANRRRHQQHQLQPQLSTNRNSKNAAFSSSASTPKLSSLMMSGGIPKVGSSGRLGAVFPRTPSGGRLVNNAMRRVRSGNCMF